MSTTFISFADAFKERIDNHLKQVLPEETRLDEAMRYCVFNGGKRVRPLLAYASAKAFQLDISEVDAIAAAIELIHAYSLVHDDLPAMDDDDLRRGLPTCHKAYDEATAILVGDALQTLAFEQLATLPPSSIATQLKLLANASGRKGMVIGQAIDIQNAGRALTLDELKTMHSAKTGALIGAACLMPAHLANAKSREITALTEYAANIGLAFQIQDDILDVTADTTTLGKPQGSDAELEKPTYTSLLGLAGARQKLNQCHKLAIQALKELPGDTTELSAIADYVVSRCH